VTQVSICAVLVAHDCVELTPLVTHHFALDDIHEAVGRFRSQTGRRDRSGLSGISGT
jgi:hypothetical protein